MRDYAVMREVIGIVAGTERKLSFIDFRRVQPNDLFESELLRLVSDELVEGEIRYDSFGTCQAFRIDGLTEEGAELWRLIENDDVWTIILELNVVNVCKVDSTSRLARIRRMRHP